MDTSGLERIAKEVLNEEGLCMFSDMVKEGRLDELKEYLLVGIDSSWTQGDLTSEVAAELYTLLDFSPERACRFRQKNLGILYS